MGEVPFVGIPFRGWLPCLVLFPCVGDFPLGVVSLSGGGSHLAGVVPLSGWLPFWSAPLSGVGPSRMN